MKSKSEIVLIYLLLVSDTDCYAEGPEFDPNPGQIFVSV